MKNNKRKDPRSKKKLIYEERVIIEQYLRDGIKKGKIAKKLGRDRKTIEREIKRNGYYDRWGNWVYRAKVAQEKTEARRKKANRKHTKLFKWEGKEFVEKVKKKMKEKGWSISATIGRYELETGKKAKVSISTMYRYTRIYNKSLFLKSV